MEKQNPNFLDADESILSSKLRFVKSEYEDELNTIFGSAGGDGTLSPDSAVVSSSDNNNNNNGAGGRLMEQRNLTYKIVIPEPGCCIKFHRQYDDSKIFVNLCVSPGIPAPREITTNELIQILKTSDLTSTFRVPMSISELRRTTDKSGKPAEVFDIAINPILFEKFESERVYYEFMMTLISETIDSKFNIAIDSNSMVKLTHRKRIGTLVSHRIENRDVQMIKNDSIQNSKSSQSLIEDMTKNYETIRSASSTTSSSSSDTKKKHLKSSPDEQSIKLGRGGGQNKRTAIHLDDQSALKRHSNDGMQTNTTTTKSYKNIEYRLIYDNDEYNVMNNNVTNDDTMNERPEVNCKKNYYIIGEFYMPNCTGGSSEITLELGEDRITVESRKRGYLLDEFLIYTIDPNRSISDFDIKRKVLTVKMPITSEVN